MNLSPHFTLEELCHSETATRRGIVNMLPAMLYPAIKATAEMMEQIRSFLSKEAGKQIPISVTSGYRCIALNRAIGSSDSSDHVLAAAVDWTAPAFGSPTDICEALAPMVGVLGIGQLINEFPDKGGWCHTSTRTPSKAVNRIISITGHGVSPGIVRV